MNLTDLQEKLVTKSGAYAEGFDAYENGIKYEQNPYLAKSWNHHLWSQGWIEAEGIDLEDYAD